MAELNARGPDELLAVLSAEQRYLAEQAGLSAVDGVTYVDKAEERISTGAAIR